MVLNIVPKLSFVVVERDLKMASRQYTYTKSTISQIHAFLDKMVIPTGLSKSQEYRWKKRFGNGKYLLLQNAVYYKDPKDGNNKKVIPVEEKEQLLQGYFNNPSTMGTSRDQFFQRIFHDFHGITKKQVQEFLLRQPSYQIHRRVRRHPVVKPIVATRPNQHWQMDLISMANPTMVHMNNGMPYCLTIIDIFSKKAWAVPLKTKEGAEITAALQKVIEAGDKPSILQSDNGTEFKNDILDGYLQAVGIKPIHSLAYTPTSQGAIERFNQTFKHLIFQHFSLYDTKKWTDVLPKLLENYNSSIHSTTGKRPSELHLKNRNSKAVKEAKTKIVKRAKLAIEQTHKEFTELKRGDWVRVRINGEGKFKRGYKPQWSKRVYQVVSRSKPANPLLRPTYALETEDSRKVTNRFGRGLLLKIPNPQLFVQPPQERPDYSQGQIFNREAHMRNLHEARRGVGLLPSVNNNIIIPSNPSEPRRSTRLNNNSDVVAARSAFNRAAGK